MIGFTFSNAFGKDLMNKPVGYLTFNEFTLVRSIFTMSLSFVILRKNSMYVDNVEANLKWILLARCLVGTLTFLVTAIAMKLLPLSVYTLIFSTNPFITAVL